MINFNKTALVLIDLQEGILKMDYAPHTAEMSFKTLIN